MESKEIPPLPVSKTKFKESGRLSSNAVTIIIPPVSCENEKVVSFFAGGCTNCSCPLHSIEIVTCKAIKNIILEQAFALLWRFRCVTHFRF